jgi:hypothetical protein
MRSFDMAKSAILVLSIVLAGAGCHKKSGVAVLTPEQVPVAVEDAFKGAGPEVKDLAAEVVSSLQNKEAPKAYGKLQNLSSRSDLTPEQREAAMRAIWALNEQLAAAAARGDQNADEMLKKYRATK